MADLVLDSSAVLADIHSEPGAEVARAVIKDSLISVVNFTEIITNLIESGVPPHEARFLAEHIGYRVEPVDQSTATTAGLLYEKTRGKGVSLADRFCLALALERGWPVVTGDKMWKELDVGVEVRLIR